MATEHDKAVLNCILNPLMPNSAATEKIQDDEPIAHEGIENSRLLEKEGVALAEKGKLPEALIIFDQLYRTVINREYENIKFQLRYEQKKVRNAIEACPINPSAYNNRAQTRRLAGKTEDALSDLNKAIELSGGKGRSACQAFVQRAAIHRLQSNDEAARADFENASKLGSSYAKLQLVALNPYAAMCNKMLAQVFNDLKEGKETE